MAPTRDAPVVLVVARRAAAPRCAGPLLHKGHQEGAEADQRKGRQRRQLRNVQRRLRAAAWLPTPAYYEWRDDPDGKTPFAVSRVDGEPVAFGGVWERWRSPEGEDLQTFATITAEANRHLAEIQDRRPVIIEQADWPLWLGETEGDPISLLRSARENVLRFWPVGKAVGNVRNDGPQLLDQITKLEPTLP